MTIRKGEPWGSPEGPAPASVLDDDAALARSVASSRGATLSVRSGDLAQTLGLDGAPRAEPLWFAMDLGFVELDDGPEIPFTAHVIARGRFWLGEGAVIMNAAWVGDRYLGPRAHPNDGLLDITVGSLPPRQLLAAAKRSKTGVHLPHPDLSVLRVANWEHHFDRPRRVEVDGRYVGRAHRLRCRVEADAYTLVG